MCENKCTRFIEQVVKKILTMMFLLTCGSCQNQTVLKSGKVY